MAGWAIMFGEDTPHDVLVDVQTKGRGYDQGNPGTAESGITLLKLDDRPDEFLGWTFGTGFALPAR